MVSATASDTAATLPVFDHDHPLVVFDGVCVLCSAWFRFILRHDREKHFRFATAQSPLGQVLYRHYGLDPFDFTTNLVIVDGRLFTELDAFAAVMRQLPPPWPLLSITSVLPKPVADFFYYRIARNRYRLFGRTDTCLMPTPDLRARFAPGGWTTG